MKKRICAILLALLVISANSSISAAAPDELSGISTGTQTDAQEDVENVDADIEDEVAATIPEQLEEIRIASADDLIAFAKNCSLDTWSVNKKVILTEDISLLGKDFDGIPTFGGIFDGQDHTITEFNISDGISYVGFFSHLQQTATVSNLSVSGTIIPAGSQIMVGGIVGDNEGTLRNCSFKGVISGNDYVGGIAGRNQLTGLIENCTSYGYIKGVHFVGGAVGHNEGNIDRCTNEAFVNTTNTDTKITIDAMSSLANVISLIKSSQGSSEEASSQVTATDIGGIAGHSIGIVARCINKGDVGYEHVGYNIGGIVGRQSGYVFNCTNNGKILGRKDVGGIAGQAEPYITVDLSSDIAYQLSEAIGKLHDIVGDTLNDAKNQSNIISNRLSVMQQYTAGAIEDVRFIADGTIDFTNDVTAAANETISRVEYVLDESTKNDGLIDQTTSAADNTKKSVKDIKKAIKDLDVEKYMDEGELEDYNNAKDRLDSISSQHDELYDRSYEAYYNEYIATHLNGNEYTSDLRYKTGDSVYQSNSDLTDADADLEKLDQDGGRWGTCLEGTWVHTADDDSSFPDTDTESDRGSADAALRSGAESYASAAASNYAQTHYQSPTGETGRAAYLLDIETATSTMTELTTRHLDEMSDTARSDALSSVSHLESAAGNLSNAGKDLKSIAKNLAGRDDIYMPSLSAEYRAHASSLVNNMAGMNDNFGLLNSEANNATGVLVDDLSAISDQFNTIMMLYTDAIDGVLDMDYTKVFEDVSLEEASICTDATIAGCSNYGRIEGDIDSSGIAGTMAIEYDFDRESDITGISDSRLNTSYITKCVLRSDNNYGEIIGEKNYAGGVCGLQEMGTIIGCGNYAGVQSSSGEYVGGIAAASYSYIVSSFSRGILKGLSYVGGIVGDGTHLRNCFSMVKIEDADSWFGAIAGHVSESGEVRNNFFVSDELAGIDRVSYTKKAEPVPYKKALAGNLFIDEKITETAETDGSEETDNESKALTKVNSVVYSDVPGEFKKLTITFMLEDDDIDGGSEVVGKIKKEYGTSLSESESPGLNHKEGYYESGDISDVDSVTTDMTITATYKRYRTTLSEENASENLIQSELLVDGKFKENDRLIVEKTFNTGDGDDAFENFETIKVTVPDDGEKTHMVRFKSQNEVTEALNFLGQYLGGAYHLKLLKDGNYVDLKPSGTMGKYQVYEIEGNEFTLSVDVSDAKKTGLRMIGIAVVVLIILIAALVFMFIFIRKHRAKGAKVINRVVKKVSDRIESKEQIFYDDSRDNKKADKKAGKKADKKADKKESDTEENEAEEPERGESDTEEAQQDDADTGEKNDDKG